MGVAFIKKRFAFIVVVIEQTNLLVNVFEPKFNSNKNYTNCKMLQVAVSF
jgi:hypothetical protein